MAERKLKEILKNFIEELNYDVVEERIINYIIRELHAGRSLKGILKDNYIKNRISQEQLDHILENPEIIEAVELEISKAFDTKDFKFKE